MVRRQVQLRAAVVPVGDQRLADNVLLRHVPTLSRVAAVLAVVAHDEVGPLRHRPGPAGALTGRLARDIRLVVQRLPVHLHLAGRGLDLDHVAGDADDALDEVAVGIGGRAENDDVTTLRRRPQVVHRVGPGVEEGDPVEDAQVDLRVGQLVNYEILPVVHAGLHALAFHAEVLHGGPHGQEDEDRQQQRLRQLADGDGPDARPPGDDNGLLPQTAAQLRELVGAGVGLGRISGGSAGPEGGPRLLLREAGFNYSGRRRVVPGVDEGIVERLRWEFLLRLRLPERLFVLYLAIFIHLRLQF